MSDTEKPSTPPPSKQDLMRSIGQVLAERRKARNLDGGYRTWIATQRAQPKDVVIAP